MERASGICHCRYNSGGFGDFQIIENGQVKWLSRNRVVDTLKRAHRIETGDMLNTDFTERNEVFLTDFGFVLKFKKIDSLGDRFADMESDGFPRDLDDQGAPKDRRGVG